MLRRNDAVQDAPAPEQRLALPYDRRVDVYGVGVAAYQLLSGARINLDIMRLRTLGADGWPHLPPLADFRPELPRDAMGNLKRHELRAEYLPAS